LYKEKRAKQNSKTKIYTLTLTRNSCKQVFKTGVIENAECLWLVTWHALRGKYHRNL